MKILHFLQTHPYWLYKLAAALVVVAFVLILVNVYTAGNEVIVYPVVVSLLPASVYILGIALLAFLGESVVYITRKPRNSLPRHVGIAALIIALTLLSIAIIGPNISNPRAHIASVQLNDHMYHLAQDGWELTNFSTVNPHALYECDGYGVMCRTIAELDIATRIYIPTPVHDTHVELVADSESNTIAILVDGETVYSYNF